MLRLAKAFWDISIWKRTPAQLPASVFLLGLMAGVAALLEVLSAFLPPASTSKLLTRLVLSVGLPLGFAWAVLLLAGRRQRFLQTGAALLGVGVLACTNIWRSALDSGIALGVVVSVAYLVLSILLEQQLLPDT